MGSPRKRRQRRSNQRRWDPFRPCAPSPESMLRAIEDAQAINMDPRAILGDRQFMNNRYHVTVHDDANEFDRPGLEGWPKMIWLSIKRLDREPIHDWRDLQRIKNEIVGPDNEAFELYPAESRVVDTANQYHLFVLADPALQLPVGFMTGKKLDAGEDHGVPGLSTEGSKQRPMQKPQK